MAELFASGRIIDIVMALTVAEAIALVLYHGRTGRGPALADWFGTVLAGLFLMLALRFALSGEWWGWLALCLLGALAAHLIDLARRWPR